MSTEDWIEMPSLLAAAKLTGVDKGNLFSALRATRKHAGGWEVKSDTVHQEMQTDLPADPCGPDAQPVEQWRHPLGDE